MYSSDASAFFENHDVVTTHAIDDGGISKLSMNPQGNTIYAAGNGGTQMVSVNGASLNNIQKMNGNRGSTTVECLTNGRIVLQRPGKNTLVLNDESLNEV